MTEKKSAVRIVCGLDVGNGYLKGRAKVDGGEPVNVDMPSVVTRAKGDTVPQEEDEAHVSALPNSLDATVVSRAAGPSGRYLFGTRAVDSGRSNVEFSIDSPDPKCNDPLSTLLVLGVVASLAVRRAFETGAGDDLDVTCTLAAALPIGDYVRFRGSYRGNLMGCSHEVVVHNFDRDIRVRVTFDDVVVLAEGAAAQYAIQSLGPVFLQTAVDAARAVETQVDAVDALVRGGRLEGAHRLKQRELRRGLHRQEVETGEGIGRGSVGDHLRKIDLEHGALLDEGGRAARARDADQNDDPEDRYHKRADHECEKKKKKQLDEFHCMDDLVCFVATKIAKEFVYFIVFR